MRKTRTMKRARVKEASMIRISLPDEVLVRLSEGQLLQQVVTEVELNNPNMCGKDIVCGWLQSGSAMGVSKTHVRNAIEGRTSLGVAGWIVVVKRSGTNLFEKWMALMMEGEK